MLSWTAHTSIDVYKLNGACQTLTYVTHVSSFLGVWYVVCFTVERYVVVHYPLRRLSLCTVTKARRTVVGLAVFAAVVYSYAAWTSGVTELGADRICAPLRRYAAVLSAVQVVDTIFTLLLPFIIISLLNVRIAVTLFRHNRARRDVIAAGGVQVQQLPLNRYARRAVNHDRDTLRLRRCIRAPVANHHDQFRVTKLLLTVSVAFLALNLPRHVTRVYALVSSTEHHYQPSLTFLTCEKLFNVVYYTHYAVNIVLYATVGGNKFRSSLQRRCRGAC